MTVTPQLNQQPKEPIDRHPGGFLWVHSIWPTIQGEGPCVGVPCVFVRLAGCNMDCPLCDTDYTSSREKADPVELADAIQLQYNYRLVVITGGEPLRQNIGPFVRALRRRQLAVQIETNGTMYEDIPWGDCLIVCSPKTPKVHPRVEQHIGAWKYVLRWNEIDPVDGLPTKVLGYNHPPARPNRSPSLSDLYVQPLDEQDPEANKRNMDAAVGVCLRYGYRLSVQVHKIAGLP